MVVDQRSGALCSQLYLKGEIGLLIILQRLIRVEDSNVNIPEFLFKQAFSEQLIKANDNVWSIAIGKLEKGKPCFSVRKFCPAAKSQ